MIGAMFDGGSMPALERLVQFTSARHRVLAHDIANVATPKFEPADLSVSDFQSSLRDAIDARRQGGGKGPGAAAGAGPLEMRDTRQLSVRPDGLDAAADPAHEGILFHDQNNRDLERIMQHLAENTLAHNTGVELLRSELSLLHTAIRERL
jgi:flagellar basal-body rod protein FlgB